MKWLVFSRNRPFQLDSFLRSANENGRIDKSDISVLHKYDAEYSEGLKTLMSEHPECTFIDESNFRAQTLDWVENVPKDILSFATDDAVFTREVQSSVAREVLSHNPAVLTVSLRLGLHLDWCYPTNRSQSVPNGQVVSGVFVWDTRSADDDWGYPLSVDGHIFRKQDALEMLKRVNFTNPNTLEANLQLLNTSVQNISCCFLRSSYFNSPLNVVQTVYKNRAGNVSIDDLNDSYSKGKRLNTQLLREFFNSSAHQEVDLLKFSS